MTLEEAIDEMLQRYPSGFVGGRVKGIVWNLGLTLQRYNPDLTIEQYRLKEDDEVDIIFIRGDDFDIASNGQFSKATVSNKFFKGFVFTEEKNHEHSVI